MQSQMKLWHFCRARSSSASPSLIVLPRFHIFRFHTHFTPTLYQIEFGKMWEWGGGVCKTGDVQYTVYLRCASIYCTGLTSEPWNGNVNILPCANVHVVCAVPHYSNTRQCIYIYVLNHVHNAMHSAHTHTRPRQKCHLMIAELSLSLTHYFDFNLSQC